MLLNIEQVLHLTLNNNEESLNRCLDRGLQYITQRKNLYIHFFSSCSRKTINTRKYTLLHIDGVIASLASSTSFTSKATKTFEDLHFLRNIDSILFKK